MRNDNRKEKKENSDILSLHLIDHFFFLEAACIRKSLRSL